MKITSLRITNTKSFREETEIPLVDGLTVFVGPNGGGKSNLLDILTIVFRGNFWQSLEVLDRPDNQGPSKIIQNRTIFGSLGNILEPFEGATEVPRRISLEFLVSEEDVNNISLLSTRRTDLEAQLSHYRQSPIMNLSFVESWQGRLSPGMKLSYQFLNGDITDMPGNSPESIFWQYLRDLELFMLLSAEIKDARFYHPFLFFPAYRSAGPESLVARLSADNFHNYMWGYFQSTSKTSTSLLKTAALYFASKMRSYESASGTENYQAKWDNDAEVKAVSTYLEQFGYSWGMELFDADRNDYRIKLARQGKEVLLSQASSGEKEVLNFLLGVCVFNVKNGLILIDEPELHLHPKWQGMLRDLLLEISRTTGNQIIVATHSPVFIHPSTVGNVVRVYKDASGASQTTKGRSDGKARDILHIVNSHNNEKLFFADKVVLVEGIQDRLVFSAYLEHSMDRLKRKEVIEVIEVHGKENFQKYKEFLLPFGVEVWMIADRDYLVDVAGDRLSAVLQVDHERIGKKVLGDKKSKDRTAIVIAIEQSLENKDLKALESVWEHVRDRHTKVKPILTKEESTLVDSIHEEQRAAKVHILRQGEIEDYLPEDAKNLDGTIKLVSDENFFGKMALGIPKDLIKELDQIAADIIGIDPEASAS